MAFREKEPISKPGMASMAKSIMTDVDENEDTDPGIKKKDKPDPRRVVDEVTIRKVDNGFTASIRYKSRKEKNKDGHEIDHYEDPSTKVFLEASDAIGILEDCFPTS